MSSSGVRPARVFDAPAMGWAQAAAWRSAYASLLPSDLLEDPDTVEALIERWREAAESPPSDRHVVLVATGDLGVVGLAAIEPATDPDLDPGRTAELSLLAVDPLHGRQGHGSRLVAAAIDIAHQTGADLAVAWLSTADTAGESLLRSGGWEPDGAHRTLDLLGDGSCPVEQHRLHTSLTDGESEPG